jgi:hypothetical protein
MNVRVGKFNSGTLINICILVAAKLRIAFECMEYFKPCGLLLLSIKLKWTICKQVSVFVSTISTESPLRMV